MWTHLLNPSPSRRVQPNETVVKTAQCAHMVAGPTSRGKLRPHSCCVHGSGALRTFLSSPFYLVPSGEMACTPGSEVCGPRFAATTEVADDSMSSESARHCIAVRCCRQRRSGGELALGLPPPWHPQAVLTLLRLQLSLHYIFLGS